MLTPLETAILDMLLDTSGEPFDSIRQQLSYAVVAQRELTGVGFFTNFVIHSDAPVRRDLVDVVIGNVSAELPSLQHGAGFLLFIRDGVASMLEGYTYGGESWPASTEGFRVYREAAQPSAEANPADANWLQAWPLASRVEGFGYSIPCVCTPKEMVNDESETE